MTYAISVPTPFNDISELAESFYSRVDEERIMLPNPDAIPEGEWVEFHITLADGSAALQGQGRCTGSFDNGEERAPEHRFDVVMDSLQLDEMGQIYFERILQVRAAYAGDEPQTGETQVPAETGYASADFEAVEEAGDDYAAAAAYAAEPEPEEYAPPEPAPFDLADEVDEVEDFTPPPAAPARPPARPPLVEEVEASDFDEPSGATEIGSIEEYIEAPVLATPGQSRIYELPPPVAPDALPSPHSVAEVLTRPVLHASWSPEPAPRMDPSPSSGLFLYAMGAGLPQPAEPPRPELDPSLRIVRAPVPSDPHAGAIFAETSAEYAESYGDTTAHEDADEARAGWEDDEEYGYGDDSTLDAEGYGAGAQEETRQVDVSGLADDVDLGEETMQVEIPEE